MDVFLTSEEYGTEVHVPVTFTSRKSVLKCALNRRFKERYPEHLYRRWNLCHLL